MKNLILNTDSYKSSHYLQYPEGTTKVHSYIEARGSTIDDVSETTFFGLQAFLIDVLKTPITQEDIDQAEELLDLHGLPFNREGWEYILNEHKGFLPLVIKAIPEGTTVKTGTPLVTVENTDENVPWITSYIETAILRAVWYPTTVCTVSREAKKIINRYLIETADSTDGLDFKLHDFGARGVSSNESAGIGGLAHLVNFQGTDTIHALLFAKRFYNCDMAGFSIPASEHSTITSWGRNKETDAFQNMISQFGNRLFACVSDSFNIYDAIENKWGEVLKDQILNMEGYLVIRPDSGNPIEVVPECLRKMEKAFGSTLNSKGYKELNPKVGLIQGDGIDLQSIPEILEAVKQAGFSTSNLAMGMGGALLQHPDRDTFKFAMKCSAIEINGVWNDVFKDPLHPGKTSKKGKQDTSNLMKVVYENGKLFNVLSLNQVRETAKI